MIFPITITFYYYFDFSPCYFGNLGVEGHSLAGISPPAY
jgi:hypothetical protein